MNSTQKWIDGQGEILLCRLRSHLRTKHPHQEDSYIFFLVYKFVSYLVSRDSLRERLDMDAMLSQSEVADWCVRFADAVNRVPIATGKIGDYREMVFWVKSKVGSETFNSITVLDAYQLWKTDGLLLSA